MDATRKPPNNRAYISGKQQEQSGSVTLDLRNRQCSTVKFIIEVKNKTSEKVLKPREIQVNKLNVVLFLQACPEDALNVLSNELKFIFDGLPLNTNLRPSLAPQSQTATIFPVSNPRKKIPTN